MIERIWPGFKPGGGGHTRNGHLKVPPPSFKRGGKPVFKVPPRSETWGGGVGAPFRPPGFETWGGGAPWI